VRYIVIRDFTAPEGRDGRARVGDFLDIPDPVRAKDLLRWGCILPEDVVPKASTVAGPALRSQSSRPGRRSQTRIAIDLPKLTEEFQSTMAGAESAPMSSTPATEHGGTDTTES
jgi:hypothetical protein